MHRSVWVIILLALLIASAVFGAGVFLAFIFVAIGFGFLASAVWGVLMIRELDRTHEAIRKRWGR